MNIYSCGNLSRARRYVLTTVFATLLLPATLSDQSLRPQYSTEIGNRLARNFSDDPKLLILIRRPILLIVSEKLILISPHVVEESNPIYRQHILDRRGEFDQRKKGSTDARVES